MAFDEVRFLALLLLLSVLLSFRYSSSLFSVILSYKQRQRGPRTELQGDFVNDDVPRLCIKGHGIRA